MALPTAPLGQLSNLNVPYQQQYYQKPKSTLDTALAAFLAGVAQQAGSQVVENTMSRDYAPDGQKASILSKMVSGPAQNRQQQMQGQAQEFEMEKQNADIASHNTRQDKEQDFLARQLASTQAEQELARMDAGEQSTALEKLRQEGEMGRMTTQERLQLENALAVEQQRTGDQSILNQQQAIENNNTARLRASLEAASPQGAQQNAAARNIEEEAKFAALKLDMFLHPEKYRGVGSGSKISTQDQQAIQQQFKMQP